VNVTIPHKSAALAVCTEASARASAIGAANTLLFEPDGRITADNTDAPALVGALRTRVDLEGCSALVLGAGGSARAAVWALLDAGAAEVQIWNRTPERAVELAAAVGGRAVISPDDFGDTDVLINCTSVGLREGDELSTLAFDAERLRRHRVIVDFVYRPGGTLFTLAAESVDVPHIDGMELLVGQGVLSFELFTGIPAPVEAMRAAVGLEALRE
jgi:shikimate dehydrogenase